MLKDYSRIRLWLEASHNTKRMLALVFACSLVVSCWGDSDDTDSDNTTSTLTASLNVSKTEHGGRFKLDAGESTIPADYQLEQVTFSITNTETGESIAQREVSDHSEPVFHYLPAGKYFVEMTLDVTATVASESDTTSRYQIQTSETLTDGMYVESEDSYTEAELDDDGNCWLICSTYDDDNTKVGCTFDFDTDSCSDIYTLSLADLLETAQIWNDDVDEDDALCIRASGAAGDDGSNYTFLWSKNYGGDGGDGGVAQTLTTYSELSSQYTDLYYLLGKKGSSTVVTGIDFHNDAQLDEDGIIVIAGGGGDGSDASFLWGDGGDGGDGATVSTALDYSSYCFYRVGSDGNENDYIYSEGGTGGGIDSEKTSCLSKYAIGGSGNSGGNGTKGFGGLSDSWFNVTDLSFYIYYDDEDGAGDGGNGKSEGADGGGGAGGGEGGYLYGGGGGGGSYAAASYVTASWCDDDYYTTNSSSYGNVTFIFSTED